MMQKSAIYSVTNPQSGFSAEQLLLIVILFALRLSVWQHPVPFHGDEDQFTQALGFPSHYPVHQPGYPAWVAMGTALHRLGLAPYTAFEFLSCFASIVAPLVFYRLLQYWITQPIAWWTALGYGVNAIVWFHGLAALNYNFAAMLGLWAAKEYLQTPGNVPLAGIACALTIILRPDYLLWIGPLLIHLSIQRPKFRISTLIALPCGTLVSILLSKWAYSHSPPQPDTSIQHTTELLFSTSVFNLGLIDGLGRSAIKLVMLLIWSMGPFLLLLMTSLTKSRHKDAILINFIWLLPALLFLLFIHMSEAAHVMPLLAPLYALTAIMAEDKWSNRSATNLLRIAAIVSIIQFSFYPWRTDCAGYTRTLNAKVAYLSAAGLRHIDHRRDIHTPSDFWPTKAHTPLTEKK